MINPWTHLGTPQAKMLAALHLREPQTVALSDGQWHTALDFCDRSHLTLFLRDAARDQMPDWVRERTDRNAEANRARMSTAEDLYRTLHSSLTQRGAGFLAMKGLAQCPAFIGHAESRVQYDIDLFIPTPHLDTARDAILALGYVSFLEMEHFPTDHLPPLIRKTGWEWRGDYFDTEIPLSIELHFRFWHADLERLPLADPDHFWDRRVSRRLAGVPFDVLAPQDALGYSCLHVMKHVLRGSGKPFHLFELACFLHTHAADDEFWTPWQSLHSPEFRRIQAVAFRLAATWFGCDLAPAAHDAIAQLPRATTSWFDKSRPAPPASPFDTSKDELGLHLSLLDDRRDAYAILRRRIFPTRLPAAVDAVHIPAEQMTLRRRLLKNARYSAYLASRIWRHSTALPGALATGFSWWWSSRQK